MKKGHILTPLFLSLFLSPSISLFPITRLCAVYSFCTNCGKPNAAYTPVQSGGPASKVVLDRTLYPLCLLSCIICRPRKSLKRCDQGWNQTWMFGWRYCTNVDTVYCVYKSVEIENERAQRRKPTRACLPACVRACLRACVPACVCASLSPVGVAFLGFARVCLY